MNLRIWKSGEKYCEKMVKSTTGHMDILQILDEFKVNSRAILVTVSQQHEMGKICNLFLVIAPHLFFGRTRLNL